MFWAKFKHTRIVKIGSTYVVVAWILLQVIETILPTFNAPPWIAQSLIFAIILGFPIILLLSWATETSKISTPVNNPIPSGVERRDARIPREKIFWAIAILGLLTTGSLAWLTMPDFSNVQETNGSKQELIDASIGSTLKLRLNLGVTGARGNGGPSEITVSPNGAYVAYSVFESPIMHLHLRDLTTFEEDKVLVSLTLNQNTGFPYFSQDSQWVYYFDNSSIKRVRVEGGPPQTLLANGAMTQGMIPGAEELIFMKAQDYGLYRLNIALGSEELLIEGDGNVLNSFPTSIPNSDHILVTRSPFRAYAEASIFLADLNSGEVKEIITQGYNARYINSGHILFTREETLWAQPFDLNEMKIDGDAKPIIFNVSASPMTGRANYAISENGTLIYIDTFQVAQLSPRNVNSPVWVDRSGQIETISQGLVVHGHPRISPNEDEALFNDIGGGERGDIWVYDFKTDTLGRRTFGAGATVGLWSLNGDRIFFNDDFGLSSVAANGADSPIIELSVRQAIPRTIDPKSGDLIFYSNATNEIFVSSTTEERPVSLLNLSPQGSSAKEPRVSPDGSFIAYSSNETGEDEIYIRTFPDIENGKWQVTRDGGNHPIWNPAANELFFWNGNDDFKYSINFEISNGGLVFSDPEAMFSSGFQNDAQGPWDYSPRRDKFLIIAASKTTDGENDQSTTLNFVTGWFNKVYELWPSSTN